MKDRGPSVFGGQDIDAGAGGNGLGNRNAAALAALDGTGWLPDVDLPSAGR